MTNKKNNIKGIIEVYFLGLGTQQYSNNSIKGILDYIRSLKGTMTKSKKL